MTLRPWLRVVGAIAALKIGLGLLGFAAGAPLPGTRPERDLVYLAHVLAFAIAAAGLGLGGRQDRRARHLALFFALVASEFADRLLTLALPRIRDFRGLSPKQFDGKGNYTFGLNEQVVFHEINQDRIDRIRGMDITFVTTASNDDEGRALLRHLGFPFRAN